MMDMVSEEKRLIRSIADGWELFAAGEYGRALWEFESVLMIDDESAIANTLAAACLLRLGRVDESEPRAREGARLEPEAALSHLVLADVLTAQGRRDEAVSEFWEAIAIKPHESSAWLRLGSLLVQWRQHDEALSLFRRAVELSPDDADSHICLGFCLMQIGQLDEAKTAMNRAVEIKPNDDLALASSASVRLRRAHRLLTTPPKVAEYRECAQLLRSALAINPDNPFAKADLKIAVEALERITKPLEPDAPPDTGFMGRATRALLARAKAAVRIAFRRAGR